MNNQFVALFVGIFLSVSVSAEIVSIDNARINEIAAYDDFEGGIIRVELTITHPTCTSGAYLNPNSPGFDHLYSLLLVQASTGKAARYQLYDDRIKAGLCEVDGIRLIFLKD